MNRMWRLPLSGGRLSDYTRGRDNNFNLLRFVAATMVLVSHSFAICSGNAADEPLRALLGMSLGDIAVDIFFAASGFLVAGSLLSRQKLSDFVLARALRIYPGLWLALVLTLVFVGTCVTTLSVADFFTDPQTWKHLAKNAVMLKGVDYALPGAFQDVPWVGAVNGSLWTLPTELRMYLLLAGLWLGASLLRIDARRWVSVACVLLSVAGLTYAIYTAWSGPGSKLYLLGAMFFVGAAMRVWQDRIPMTRAAVLALVVALLAAMAVSTELFTTIYRLALPYLVLSLAYLPAGGIRRFNTVGDYSYGMYVYAFPVQQSLAHFWPGIGPYEMIAASFPLTLALAMSSWHWVEERSLRLKDRLLKWPPRSVESSASPLPPMAKARDAD